MYMTHLDTDSFNVYLIDLKMRSLIMDNASFHKSKNLKIPENIHIEYIPPYSPELNLQEEI